MKNKNFEIRQAANGYIVYLSFDKDKEYKHLSVISRDLGTVYSYLVDFMDGDKLPAGYEAI